MRASNHAPSWTGSTDFLCLTLVGREIELGALRNWLASPDRFGRRVSAISGEAGVGKSRLISELLRTTEAADWTAVRVSCLPTDQREPFALVLQLARAAGGDRRDLPIGGAPEAERQIRRVQYVLEDLLQQHGGGRPTLVIGEDLQWSDAPSLHTLLGLAQSTACALLVTYREDSDSAPLAGFLGELTRLRRLHDLPLSPLGRADVAAMIRHVLHSDRPVPRSLVDEVIESTGGVPFMIEEVLRTLVETGALQRDGEQWRRRPGVPLHAPRSLRQLIRSRLGMLPDSVVQVATLAAVLSPVVEVSQLALLLGQNPDRVQGSLRSLVNAQVLAPQSNSTLAFRHALIQDAILEELLPHERQELHRQVATALASVPGTSPAVLAGHWFHAGDSAQAGPHALAAAASAAAVHAHREAIAHYEMALAARAGERAQILRALGDHHAALGDRASALEHYEKALRTGPAADDPARAGELHYRVALAHAMERDRPHARHELELALAVLPTSDSLRWQAGLQLALQLAGMGEYPHAESVLLQALEDAPAKQQLPRLRVTYELGGLRAIRGDWASLQHAGESVLAEVSSDNDDALALRHDAHAALGTLGYYRGDAREALEHFRSCLQIAQHRGLTSDEGLARWNIATNALYHLGRWHEARVELRELQAITYGGMVEGASWFEAWMNGAWEQAVEQWLDLWTQVLEPAGDLEALAAHGRRVADILLALGRLHEARSLVESVLARIRSVQAVSFELQLSPREAEILARLGDPDALSRCNANLAVARAQGGRPAEALLLRARGIALCNQGAWTEAFADFSTSYQLLLSMSMVYEAARTRREAGRARLSRSRRGDREHAATHLRDAQRLFAELDARRDEAVTADILSAAGLAERPDRDDGPLTAREREVAELIGQGLTNREIADRLFITEKTAAYHVGHILAKLGFDSRAQIAAYVARLSSPDRSSS